MSDDLGARVEQAYRFGSRLRLAVHPLKARLQHPRGGAFHDPFNARRFIRFGNIESGKIFPEESLKGRSEAEESRFIPPQPLLQTPLWMEWER